MCFCSNPFLPSIPFPTFTEPVIAFNSLASRSFHTYPCRPPSKQEDRYLLQLTKVRSASDRKHTITADDITAQCSSQQQTILLKIVEKRTKQIPTQEQRMQFCLYPSEIV